MMADNKLPIYSCPVCARPSSECDNNRRASRQYANSSIRRIKRSLFHYRSCKHCGIVFKVAKLEACFYQVVPRKIWRMLNPSLPNSNWIEYPRNDNSKLNYLELNQEIQPAKPNNLPQPFRPARHNRATNANHIRPFHMEINCQEIGLHFAMVCDGLRDKDSLARAIKKMADLTLRTANEFFNFLKAVFVDPIPQPHNKTNRQHLPTNTPHCSLEKASLSGICQAADKATIDVAVLRGTLVTAEAAEQKLDSPPSLLVETYPDNHGTSLIISPSDPQKPIRAGQIIVID